MNSYELSRAWFDFAFENPEKINPTHSAIYFFAIEHCNRLGWKEKFGFPTQMAMDAIGLKRHQTYMRYFKDLVDWGFFVLVQKSENQYSSNVISLHSGLPKNRKALDKALLKHTANHPPNQKEITVYINKPINQEPINHLTEITQISEWQQWMLESQQFQDATLMAVHHLRPINHVQLVVFINQFAATQNAKGRKYANINEARAHFVSWLMQVVEKEPVEVQTNRPSHRKL